MDFGKIRGRVLRAIPDFDFTIYDETFRYLRCIQIVPILIDI